MNNQTQDLLSLLQNGHILSQEQARDLQANMLNNTYTKQEITQIFEAFEKRPPTAGEFVGIIDMCKESMVQINTEKLQPLLDVTGTGGDRLKTFNISTLTAILSASLGVRVAKHGSRSNTSIAGCADTLETLGIQIDRTPEETLQLLQEVNIAFLFAPLYHPSFKNVKEARLEYGKPTYFNFLGPLINPANPTHQLLGVSDKTKIGLLGEVLMRSGKEKVIIVHSKEGLDEVSVFGETEVFEYLPNQSPKHYIFNPRNHQIKHTNFKEIQISTLEEAKKVFLNVLTNQASPAQRDIVIINTAFALLTSNKVQDIADGIFLAQEALLSGRALQKFEEFKNYKYKS